MKRIPPSVPSSLLSIKNAARLGAILAVLAAFAILWLAGFPDVPRLERAPAFAALTVEGDRLEVTDPPGQPVVINFWATWCAPCVIEMPRLEAAHQQHHTDDNLLLIGINMGEDEENVRAWLAERDITFPVVIDPFRELELAYEVGGVYPTTIFIDSDGNIVRVHRGLITEAQLQENLALIGIDS